MTEQFDIVIIGAGLSGLVVADRIIRKNQDARLLLLDKSDRVGGVIRSFEESGFRAELGPHGFLDNCKESRTLLQETGLDQESVKAPLSTFVRYVCINGELKLIPQSPLKIITAPLIPWKDKFRVLGDLFKKPLDGEPTVAKWAHYRFGKALLPYVDAVFTGTYAGDYNELKIDAVMPGVRAMEKTYGSVIRGAVAKAWAAKRSKTHGGKLAMPSMTSFPDGMQRLTEKLGEVLQTGSELRLNCPAEKIVKQGTGWKIVTGDGELSSRSLVLALPVNRSLSLLKGFDSSMVLDSIPEAWINTVVFGFRDEKLPPGFGFLTPDSEQRFSLGTLFSSNMFPNRAPAGHIVFETLVGGRRHPERVDLSDDELIEKCLFDANELLGIKSTPVFTRVLRPDGGIPQLEQNYPALLDWRNDLVRRFPGIYICGFGWDGIGINDMIKAAFSVAEKAGTGAPQVSDEAEVKKVYF